MVKYMAIALLFLAKMIAINLFLSLIELMYHILYTSFFPLLLLEQLQYEHLSFVEEVSTQSSRKFVNCTNRVQVVGFSSTIQ